VGDWWAGGCLRGRQPPPHPKEKKTFAICQGTSAVAHSEDRDTRRLFSGLFDTNVLRNFNNDLLSIIGATLIFSLQLLVFISKALIVKIKK
jgi:hypothetical protein